MNHRKLTAAILLAGLATGTAYAAAPLGRYEVTAQTVTDNRTRLTWQRVVPPDSYTQAQAVSYCGGLALAGGGWRLPAIAELQSIMDVTRARPSIDAVAFPNTPGVPFWSASTGGWTLDFGYGMTGPYASTSAQRVRCVR